MPRTDVGTWTDRAEKACLIDGRYADMGIRFRIYVRGANGEAVPGDWIGPVFGGLYDRAIGRYIGPPLTVHEVSLTEATADFVLSNTPGVMRRMLVGAPGVGKTFALVRRKLRRAVELPNHAWGGVGATDERRRIIWDEYRALVEPMGFMEVALEKRKEIHLWNNSVHQIIAGTPPSKQAGTPIQGRSWREAFVDEHQSISAKVHQEIDARGRRFSDYCVNSTATNQTDIPDFAAELDTFERNPESHNLIRVSGFTNPFVPTSFYEKLKSRYSPRDFAAIIEGKAVPPEEIVYHQYDSSRNLRKRPPDSYDITGKVLAKMGEFRYLAGQDFGVLINATEVMRCYSLPDGRKAWWVVDEIKTVRELYQTHAREILRKYYAKDILVIGDPHHNVPRKDIDKSPYRIFRSEGLTIRPARRQGFIPIEHRIEMMNALLQDAHGNVSLFIDIKDDGKPAAPELHRAFLTEKRTATGATEGRKNLKEDWSHYPAATGYGLFPFEQFRATVGRQVRTLTEAA